jgi:hypothetical protein
MLVDVHFIKVIWNSFMSILIYETILIITNQIWIIIMIIEIDISDKKFKVLTDNLIERKMNCPINLSSIGKNMSKLLDWTSWSGFELQLYHLYVSLFQLLCHFIYEP